MTVLVVRHADALSRHGWYDDDRLRPLSPKGEAQAAALVGHLAEWRVDTVVSSPAVRCTATVEPLAAARGLSVVTVESLWEGSHGRHVRGLLDEVGHTVICSHGDLIPDLVNRLAAEGMTAVGHDCKKGSTWVLERDGARFVRGTYLPPPPIR